MPMASLTDDELQDLKTKTRAAAAEREKKDFNTADLFIAEKMSKGDPLTAELLRNRVSNRFLFDVDKNVWLKYQEDSGLWIPDPGGSILNESRKVSLSLLSIARAIASEGKRAEIASWAIRVQTNITRMKAACELLKVDPSMQIRSIELDSDRFLLNCQNGMLNLKTFNLNSHSPEYLATKQVSTHYDCTADAPRWTAFLNEIFPNKEVQAYMQRRAGYFLTGSTCLQKFWADYGIGANGKSVFHNVFIELLADYATTIDSDVLMESSKAADGNSPSPAVAALAGRRFILAPESTAGQKLKQGLVKKISGGEKISARFLHGNLFEYVPQGKIVLMTNHLPKIINGGLSIWRRLRTVPFSEVIPPEKQDKNLSEKLRSELPGILAWAVEGLKKYQKIGLEEPAAILNSTKKYEQSQDIISNFIDDECILQSGFTVLASMLYKTFRVWCETSGERPIPERDFKMYVLERGIKWRRTNTGRVYDGVILKNETPF